MAFLRLLLKKEMCKRRLSNEGMTGKRLHLKPVVPEHFGVERERRRAFLPLCMCGPSGVSHKCTLSGLSSQGKGFP